MTWLTRRRRQKIMAEPFPPAWRELMGRNVPYLRVLTEDESREMEGLVQVFLAEKRFEGAGGLEVTDEVRVTIASQACLLLLGRQTDIYPALRSIIVYPYEYVAPMEEYMPDGTVLDEPEERSGESWSQGAVALSWSDVLFGASDPFDGENVVLHEFAHQLDEETGESNGVPRLSTPAMYTEWARVMTREYEALVRRVDRGRETLLDEYAAENPAEFFAVATEFYFERPAELMAQHGELYEQLLGFYGQDTAGRFMESKRVGAITAQPRRKGDKA